MASNFKCESSKHGKLIVPEELVRTEMEEIEERRRRQYELVRLHERAHFDPDEKELLRDSHPARRKLMASKIPDYLYILMKDIQGEKALGKLMAVLSAPFIGGPKPIQVLRGELLTQIPPQEWLVRNDGRPPHNYRTKRDPSVTLYGGEDNDHVIPLNGRDLQLLEAIEKPYDRFAVFSEDSKLEWGGRLKRGDQVYVKLPGDNASAHTWSVSVVRHVGPVESLPGRNFGVEIKVSV